MYEKRERDNHRIIGYLDEIPVSERDRYIGLDIQY